MIFMAFLMVVLYWLVATQFCLPASKEANLKLSTINLRKNFDDEQWLRFESKLKAKERDNMIKQASN